MPGNDQLDRFAGIGGSHQQAAQKLAGYVTANVGPSAAQSGCVNHHWRTAPFPQAAHVDTQLSHRLDQVGDRTLAHPLRSVELVLALSQGNERRQKAHGSAAIADE